MLFMSILETSMRYLISGFAGTALISAMAATAAIAQVTYRPCVPEAEQYQTISYMDFGRTRQGDRLGLNPNSVVPVRGGVYFTYYLNHRAMDGFATCSEFAWDVNGQRFAATSPAAKAMVNYICGDRVSTNR
jgi:hypothetical protein